ncbi:glyoxylate reductase [Bacillus pakistanensis]|uniref:Glyoxylate reductase n=1 Tax=Rossellomorea pakistanensis TaxID=992288 RepID=A0ABS2NED5_9BACI|nr:D-glycerate dehydrogenase [Bacillus pakistanensis]MBM7586214.1 glyoxylate reductase [Bacillus pakistanensis]
MKKPFIYITRKLPDDIVSDLRDEFYVEMWESEDVPVPREILLEKVKEANGLLTMLSDQINSEVFQHAPSLKIVANLAVGYDNIDIKSANKFKVAVCNTPDVLTDTTADLTFGLLLATARRLTEASEFVKSGEWTSWSPMLLAGTDVHHKTIGIFGMGKIGEAVAKRAKGFEMEIIYHNRSRKQNVEKDVGARYVEFEELLTHSDFLVCLAPLSPETKETFKKEQFAKMKKSSFFINAARGPIVNENDLYVALKNGLIKGAGLDVFDQEPINRDHQLLTLKNVVALPHIGSATVETRTKMMSVCVENVKRVLSDQKPITIVNEEWLTN